MSNLNPWRRGLVLGAILALVFVGAAYGQTTGQVVATVTDADGASLPGVTTVLSGFGADRTQISDANGTVRFVNLDPGVYDLKATLEGLTAVDYTNITVNLGRATAIELRMAPSVDEVLTVTSESPLLDERQLKTGTTVSQVELEKIPTARDPWALLSQTPGVAVDRINVGGSESGQQSVFRAQGVQASENDFMVDGVQITDMGATGASPTYYDFDQFAEMNFNTGGSDVTKNTAGVQLNMVTKRGTNEFRGSGRYYVTDADGYFGGGLDQGGLDVSSELNTANGQELADYSGTQLSRVQDIGFEAGGAAWRDHLWLWGSWGQNDIDSFASSGDRDDTLLENTSIKANAQFTQANSAVASYNNGDKIKNGRGAGPTRASQSLWDQRGPSAIYRFEDTHVVSSNFFLTGQYSIVDLGFSLTARGPDDVPNGLDPAAPDPRYADGVWEDNFLSGASSRPGDEFKLDSSYFFTGGNSNHELKIGGRFRTVEGSSLFQWGPRNVFTADWDGTIARHSSNGPSTNEYLSIWAQDTITLGRMTINAGLRFDEQTGSTDPASFEAHAVLPELLPAFSVAGKENISMDTITPRLGFTYALGADRDTLLRATFSQFASQLGVGLGNWESPTYYGWYAYFYTSTGELYAASYFDPLNPSVSPNRYAPGLDPELTNELILGAEHALLPQFVVGATFTYRLTEDIHDYIQMVRTGDGGSRAATIADYEIVGAVTGTIPRTNDAYNVPVWDLKGQLSPLDSAAGAPSGGRMVVNGPREREYQGLAVNFTKRLANRWMARGFISYGDAEWQNIPVGHIGCGQNVAGGPNDQRGGGCRNGQLFVERSTGSGKGERFLQSTWSWNLNGMYQVAPERPWGFNVAANIAGREGHPIAYYDAFSTTLGSTNINVAGDLDNYRLDDVMTIDLRLEKEFAATEAMNLTFGIDAFNLTNENTGLSYQAKVDTGSMGNLQDNISPRVFRLGVRLGWR